MKLAASYLTESRPTTLNSYQFRETRVATATVHTHGHFIDLHIADLKAKGRLTSIDDYLADIEGDDDAQHALSEASKTLAHQLYPNEVSIRKFRMSQGMSQMELALKMETNQGHVSRIESGSEDVRLSTITRLAGALDMNPHDILDALLEKK